MPPCGMPPIEAGEGGMVAYVPGMLMAGAPRGSGCGPDPVGMGPIAGDKRATPGGGYAPRCGLCPPPCGAGGPYPDGWPRPIIYDPAAYMAYVWYCPGAPAYGFHPSGTPAQTRAGADGGAGGGRGHGRGRRQPRTRAKAPHPIPTRSRRRAAQGPRGEARVRAPVRAHVLLQCGVRRFAASARWRAAGGLGAGVSLRRLRLPSYAPPGGPRGGLRTQRRGLERVDPGCSLGCSRVGPGWARGKRLVWPWRGWTRSRTRPGRGGTRRRRGRLRGVAPPAPGTPAREPARACKR